MPAEDWFAVRELEPGIHLVCEPPHVNSYLISGSAEAVLFDTGMGISNIRAVAEDLTNLPVSVLNSHTHNDHVGDNWRFSDIYGMDTDFTRNNAKGSREDAQAEIAPGEVCGDFPPGFNPAQYATRPFQISHWMHDHDKIDLGGRTLEIIATPGHTPDAIALLDGRNGLLFTGDTFYAGPIWLFRPETDLNAYVASVKKLASLAPNLQLLLPAHNTPAAEPGNLPHLVNAIEEVRSGKATSISKDGKREYVFEGFSFLMSK